MNEPSRVPIGTRDIGTQGRLSEDSLGYSEGSLERIDTNPEVRHGARRAAALAGAITVVTGGQVRTQRAA
jgi:hypothetical protein